MMPENAIATAVSTAAQTLTGFSFSFCIFVSYINEKQKDAAKAETATTENIPANSRVITTLGNAS